MSFKPEVFVGKEWVANGIAFATRQEAEDNARSLMDVWIAVKDWRAVESDEAVNYTFVDGKLERIGEPT